MGSTQTRFLALNVFYASTVTRADAVLTYSSGPDGSVESCHFGAAPADIRRLSQASVCQALLGDSRGFIDPIWVLNVPRICLIAPKSTIGCSHTNATIWSSKCPKFICFSTFRRHGTTVSQYHSTRHGTTDPDLGWGHRHMSRRHLLFDTSVQPGPQLVSSRNKEWPPNEFRQRHTTRLLPDPVYGGEARQ